MSVALANFLFEAANLLLLAAVLGWLLFRPVRRALDAEREQHEAEKAETQRLHAEADRLAREARQARQAVEQESEKQRREILTAARAQAADLQEQARQQQHAERQAFREELETTRKADAAALAETVGRMAADAVRQLLAALPGPSLDTALITAACAELEAMPATARKSALVESARALDDSQRSQLAGVLGDGFTERVVADLGAGVRVTTSAGQVNATAAAIALHGEQVVSHLKTAPSSASPAETDSETTATSGTRPEASSHD